MPDHDLPDIQDSADTRNVQLDNVGVSNLVYPIKLRVRGQDESVLLSTVGTFEASVRLPMAQRGTHMSRLVSVVDKNAGAQLSLSLLQQVAVELCNRLEAPASRVAVAFEYFVQKVAPVSRETGYMNYSCHFEVESNVTTILNQSAMAEKAHNIFSWLTVEAPVMSLCPCSKEISDYGAHNQRCHVKVRVGLKDPINFLWIEDLVELIETCASSPVYPILKRPDERHVTMTSYDNPTFVEDVARNVVVKLRPDPRVKNFLVEVKSQESIHNHEAFARVCGPAT